MKPLGMTITLMAAVATTVGMLTAATAHADKQSFLDAIGGSYYPPSSILTHGHLVCEEIRGGMSPMDAQRKLGIFGLGPLSDFVGIAQRELCPDTLG